MGESKVKSQDGPVPSPKRIGPKGPLFRKGSKAQEVDFDPLATCPKKWRPRFEALARKSPKSLISAIKLKCIDCCAWERPEAKKCHITSCPLYMLNLRGFRRDR